MLFRQTADTVQCFMFRKLVPSYALSFLFYGSALATKLRLLGNKNSLENCQRFVTFNFEYLQKNASDTIYFTTEAPSHTHTYFIISYSY